MEHHNHHATHAASATDQHEDALADVVIIGGGAAGLSGALALSRVRRSVIVIDAGEPRNAPAAHMHNVLTRDGTPPREFLALARREVEGYGTLVIEGRATSASTDELGRFRVALDDGRVVLGRRLLVATGLVDQLPEIEGLAGRWGRDVLHCPYCHGWEVRDQAIAVISTGPRGTHQALMFRQVSPAVTLFVHSGPPPTDDDLRLLAARGITVVDEPVGRIEIEDDRIVAAVTVAGRRVPVTAVTVLPRWTARSGILADLGLEAVDDPMGMGTAVPVDPTGATAVAGVWVAGNVTNLGAGVIQAAAAGTTAGAMINGDLVMQEAEAAAGADNGSAPNPEVMDAGFWERRYDDGSDPSRRDPSAHLVSAVEGVLPGRALDLGAGDGGNAVWLAEQGWQVTAVEISERAIERGRAVAETAGADIAERITWVHADATTWTAPDADFDLATMHFVHPPDHALRDHLYRLCADSVAPGGTLLLVDHHPGDGAGRGHPADWWPTPGSIAGQIERDRLATDRPDAKNPNTGWEVVIAAPLPRTTQSPAGDRVTAHDTVVLARRSSV